MENWQNLYIELSEKLSADLDDNELEFYNKLNTIAEHDGKSPIRWLDLWHNQVNFLEEELEFPTPAVFLSFRSGQVNAYWIGRRMSGTLRFPITVPSQNSTRECTTDCGWIKTSIRSPGMSNK